MYAFQSESTLYSCLNFKELLAQNRCNIRSLSDSNGIWTHNDLVRKGALNHSVKLAIIESRFIVKRLRDMKITYSQMYCTDKHSQHSSLI